MNRPPRGAWTWGPLAGAALAGALLLLPGANHAAFAYLNHAGAALGEPLWANLSLLGDGAVVLALVLPAIRRFPQCFWAALIGAVLAGLYVQGIKQLVDVPRPLAVLGADSLVLTGPHYRAVSFPSGHAAAIFAFAGIWIMGSGAGLLLRLGLLLLAVLVSLSRVMVGVHWPLDLAAGMFGGWAAAWCGLALAARRGWRTASGWGLAAGVALVLLAGALLFSRHVGMALVLPLQRTIGLACLTWGIWEMVQLLPRWLVRRHPEGK